MREFVDVKVWMYGCEGEGKGESESERATRVNAKTYSELGTVTQTTVCMEALRRLRTN